MRKTLIAAAVATTALSAPAMAQTKWIDGLKVTVMPAPKCDFGVPFPSEVTTFGEPGPATINITRGRSPLGADPFVGTKLAGLSPYVSLTGAYKHASSIYWQFEAPHKYVQILWGTPDQWNALSFFDETGRVELGRITGAALNRRFNGGVEPQALNLLVESPQPFHFVMVGSRGTAFEIANVAFDAEEHCR